MEAKAKAKARGDRKDEHGGLFQSNGQSGRQDGRGREAAGRKGDVGNPSSFSGRRRLPMSFPSTPYPKTKKEREQLDLEAKRLPSLAPDCLRA